MASLSYPKSVRLHLRKDFDALLNLSSTHYNAVFKVFWKVNSLPGAERVLSGEGSGASATDQAQNVASSGNLSPETALCGDKSGFSGDVSRETAVCGDSCRFAVSVPKKSFKRAVKRNLLKRRIREAIRLNRQSLPEGFCADFLFFYRVGEVLEYADIEKAVVEAFTAIPGKAAAKAEREAESETAANCDTEKPAGDE